MSTFEEYLRSKTGNNATATRRTPTVPAVIRRSDVMKTGFDAPAPSINFQSLEAPKPGGFMGVLADIMDSPLGKVVTKAGEVISIPGKTVVSGIKEFVDYVDRNPETVASWNDFTKQIADPTFGFGTVVGDVTGNSWVNRIIGFAGDIALDPLTWVTFGGNQALKVGAEATGLTASGLKGGRFIGKGLTSVAGRKGREALGAHILDVLGDADLASQAVKRGRAALSHLSDDAFEQLGLNRAGVYFMGRRIKGTEKLGQIAENGLTNMRVWSNEHVYRRLADIFTEDDVAIARRALRSGEAPPERVETYLRMVMSENEGRAAGKSGERFYDESLRALIDDIGLDNLKANRRTLDTLLEGKDINWVGPNARVPSTPQEFMAQKIARFLDDKWNRVDDAVKAADPNANIGKVDGYFPHVLKPEARNWIMTNESPHARNLREMLFTPLNDSGAFKSRMTFGDKFFGETLGGIETRTARNLNKIANNGGFKGEFFETDIIGALQAYRRNYGQQMNTLARRKYIVDSGVLEKIPTIVKNNVEQIQAGKKIVQGITSNRKNALTNVGTRLKAIKSTLHGYADTAVTSMESEINRAAGYAADAAQKVKLTNADIYKVRTSLMESRQLLRQQEHALQALYDDTPDIVVALEEDFSLLTRQLEDVETNIALYSNDAKKFSEVIAKLESDHASLVKNNEKLIGVAEIIQSNIDDIIEGRKVSGAGSLPRNISEATATPKSQAARKIANGQKNAVDDFVKNSPDYIEATIDGDISARQLKRMTREQIASIVVDAASGKASVAQMREATMWIAAVSPWLRDAVPALYDEAFRANGVMSRAARADAYHQAYSKAAARGKRFMRVTRISDNLRKANIDFRDNVRRYVAAKNMLAELFGDSRSSLGGQIGKASLDADPYGTLETLLAKSEYSALAPFFSRILDKDTLIAGSKTSLTGDSIVDGLDSIVVDFSRQSIKLDTTANIPALAAGKDISGTAGTVYMRDYQATIDYLLKHGSSQDIEDMISLATSGRLANGGELEAMVVDRARKSSGGGKVWSGQGPETASIREAIYKAESRIATNEANAEFQKELAGAARLMGDSQQADMLEFAADFELKFLNDAIRETIKDLLKREVGVGSIEGRIARSNKLLKKLAPDLPTDLGAQIIEEAIPDLQMTLLRMSFHQEVYRRVYDTAEVMASAGLTMPDSTLHRIVNKVAREQSQAYRTSTQLTTKAQNSLNELLIAAKDGAYTNVQLFKAIEDTIVNEGLSPVLTRAIGRSDAERLWKESAYYGRRTIHTKEFQQRLDNLTALENASKDMSLTPAERARAAAKYKSAMKKPGMMKQRKQYFDTVLVPWYESIFGPQTKKPTYGQVFDTLEAYVIEGKASMSPRAIERRLRRGEQIIVAPKLGYDASVYEMTKWLETTIDSLGGHRAKTERIVKELNRAADPFFSGDMSSVLKDTPSTVAYSIKKLADDIASQSAFIQKAKGQLAEQEGKIATFTEETLNTASTIRAVIEAPVGKQGPISALRADEILGLEAGSVVEARRALREIVDLKSRPQYFGAVNKREELEFLSRFADLDITEPIELQTRLSVKSDVAQAINSGKIVAYAKAKSRGVDHTTGTRIYEFEEWVTVSSTDEIPDEVFRLHENGSAIRSRGAAEDGTYSGIVRRDWIVYFKDKSAEGTSKLRLVDPEAAAQSMAMRQAKLLQEAEKEELAAARLLAAGPEYKNEWQKTLDSAKRKRARAERMIVPSETSQGFDNTLVSKDVLPFGRGLDKSGNEARITQLEMEITKLSEDLNSTPRPVGGKGRQLHETDEKGGEVEARVAWAKSQIDANKMDIERLRSESERMITINDSKGNAIVLERVDIEALFNVGSDKWVKDLDGDLQLWNRRKIEIERSIATGKINSTTAQILEDEARLDESLAVLLNISGRGGKRGRVVAPEAKSIQKMLIANHEVANRVLESELNRINRFIEELEFTLSATTKEANEAAMYKVREIRRAIERGDLTQIEFDDMFDKLRKVDSSVANYRRFEVTDKFENSAGGRLLARIADIEDTEAFALSQKLLSDARNADDIVSRLRVRAQKFSDRISTLETGGDVWVQAPSGRPVQQTFRALPEVENDLMAQLAKVSEVSNGMYDALAKYNEYTLVGVKVGKKRTPTKLTHSEAIDRIIEEANALKPPFDAIEIAPEVASKYAKNLSDSLDTLGTYRDRLDAVNISLNAEQARKIALEDALAPIEKSLSAQRKKWASRTAEKAKTANRKIGGTEKQIEYQKEQARALIETMYGTPSLRSDAKAKAKWAETTKARLSSNIDDVKSFVEELDKKVGLAQQDAKEIPHLLDFLDEAEGVLRMIEDLNPSGVRNLKPGQVDPKMNETLVGLRADLLGSYYGLLSTENTLATVKNIQRALEDGTIWGRVEKKVSQGFVSLKHVGLPSYQGQEWLSEMFVNISRLQQPTYSRYLSKFLGRYTGFFKAYAVSTPGFVVRNAISNTFMLFAGGADVGNMTRGLELYRAWNSAVKGGREAKWLASLGEQERNVVQRAIKAMDASGYGRGQDALASFNPNRRWLVDNKWVNFIRTKNDLVDGSARFIMAYDSVAKGGTFDQAVARVKRYFFDYESISAGDEFMRGIVPFWFWMSRNLPMQIANMYQNPRAYLMYNKAMRAVGMSDDGDVVPGYLKEQGAIKVGDNWYFAPDVGFNRVSQQFNELADPMRLLSYVNPGLRVPVELMGNRKFYNNQPFWDKGQEPVGSSIGLGGPVQALAELLGQTSATDAGTTGVTDRVNYGLTNLIPLLAQGERLVPSTEYGKSRQASSILGFLGVPFREVTPQAREAELRRQERLRNG